MSAKGVSTPIDPHRRERILDAALMVLRERGIDGLTHRRVAAAAGVPLGATSYYFRTIEDLLAAALQEAVNHDRQAITERLATLPDGAGVATALADTLFDLLDAPDQSLVAVELYAAALRRTHLREIALAWDAIWLDSLSPKIGTLAASAVVATLAGLLERALMQDGRPSEETIIEILRYVLHESPEPDPGRSRRSEPSAKA